MSVRRILSRPSVWAWCAGCAIALTGAPASPADDGILMDAVRTLNPRVRRLETARHDLQRQIEALPPPAIGREGERLGYHSPWFHSPDVPLTITVDLGRAHRIDAIALVPVTLVFRNETHHGYGFPKRFVVEVATDAAFSDARAVFDSGLEDVPSPGAYPFTIDVPGLEARHVRLRVLRQWRRPDGRNMTALSELIVMSGHRHVAVGAAVEAPSATSLPVWGRDNLVDGQTNLGPPTGRVPSATNGFRTESAKDPRTPKWVCVDLGREFPIEEVRLIPAHPFDAPNRYGHGFPVRFQVRLASRADFSDAILIADHAAAAFPNPGDNPVILPAGGARARFVRLDATELWHVSGGNLALAMAEMQVYSGGENIARGTAVSASDSLAAPAFYDVWAPPFLVDGFSSENDLIELDAWLDAFQRRRTLEQQRASTEAALQDATQASLLAILLAAMAIAIAAIACVSLTWFRRRRQLARATERLRTQISRDLHDDLGSRLGGMRLLSEVALEAPELTGAVREDVAKIHEASREALAATHDIVWLTDGRAMTFGEIARHLRRVTADTLGPIEWTFEESADAPGAQVTFERRRQLLLAFREALGNALRHARATHIDIRLRCESGRAGFRIRDDGVGFDAADEHAGHGLRNLRRRAEAFGGSCAIGSRPGGGTTIEFELPMR